mgnify:CR=1 FL=1
MTCQDSNTISELQGEDRGLNNSFEEFFDALFAARDSGQLTTAQVGDFFPQEVKERCAK